MKNIVKLALAGSLLVAGAPLLAKSSAAQGSESGAGAARTAKAEPKKYCLRVEANTGTRVAAPRCKTKQQWQEEGVEIGNRR